MELEQEIALLERKLALLRSIRELQLQTTTPKIYDLTPLYPYNWEYEWPTTAAPKRKDIIIT